MLTVGNTPGVSDYNIVVKGTGNSALDEANLAAAVSSLNGLGKGTLWIDGSVILLNDKNFTAPIHLKGLDQDAEIVVQSTNPSFVSAFAWNPTFTYSTPSTTYSISNSKTRAEYITTSGTGYTPTEGDWILLYDFGASISGVEPHNVGGTQGPMEIHQIHEYDSSTGRSYTSDPVIDLMNVSGTLAVIDFQENVEVENLKFRQTTSQIDFQNALHFRKINGVKVKNVRMDRNGVGAIYANYCVNVDISDVSIEGTLKNDNVYGIVAGVVNGFTFRDSIVHGTRHVFTTTAGASSGLKRMGTPLNCKVSNVSAYLTHKVDASNVATTRVALDTHAEGWGVTFENCNVYGNGILSNIAAQTRSRYSVFKNCKFFGSKSVGSTSNGTKGVRIGGLNAVVDDCVFDGFWRPLEFIPVVSGNTNHNGVIKNCLFKNTTSSAIILGEGSGHTITGCHFMDCASLYTGTSEFGDVIRVSAPTYYNHLISNCVFVKDSARCAINSSTLTPSQLKVVSNTFIGFSYPTSSGPLGFLSSGVYGQNMELAYAYSNHYDNVSYTGRKAGQDALGNISGIYTLHFESGTYDNKTAVLNNNLTLTATGLIPGQYHFLMSQDATGGRTITWSNVNWNGTDPQPKASGLTTSLFQLYYDGMTWYGTAYFNN